MQEFFQGHGAKSQQFYNKLLDGQAQFAWELKRKISKKCAFTLNQLKIPIRSLKCKTLKCVYEQEVIQAILQKYGKDNDTFKCIQCEEEIKKEDLFFDSELSKAIKLEGVCYLKFDNPSQNSLKANFKIVNKNNKQAQTTIEMLPDDKYQLIENSQNKQLLQILALNVYKQRMETLFFLMNQNKESDLQKYAKEEFSKEKNNIEKWFREF